MQILFTLDPEDGIDPNDPLGDITLSDNQTTLSVESTYLDSWFDSLIKGFKSLQTNQKITLDLIEEPETLTFEPILDGFKISYGKQTLLFNTLNEFYQPLLLSAQQFLSQLDQNNNKTTTLPNLINIRHFIEQSILQSEQELNRIVIV
jgi:hypothetical protein